MEILLADGAACGFSQAALGASLMESMEAWEERLRIARFVVLHANDALFAIFWGLSQIVGCHRLHRQLSLGGLFRKLSWLIARLELAPWLHSLWNRGLELEPFRCVNSCGLASL